VNRRVLRRQPNTRLGVPYPEILVIAVRDPACVPRPQFERSPSQEGVYQHVRQRYALDHLRVRVDEHPPRRRYVDAIGTVPPVVHGHVSERRAVSIQLDRVSGTAVGDDGSAGIELDREGGGSVSHSREGYAPGYHEGSTGAEGPGGE